MFKELVPWILAGAGLLILVIVIQYNVDKRKALVAQQEAPVKAAQVQVIPADFPYSQQMTDYCLQAAQAGWTPENCEPLYEYAQLYYPQFATYLGSYWPWYYENYYYPYYGTSSWWWPGSYGYWYGGGCRGGRCGRRHGRRGRRSWGGRRGSRGGRRSWGGRRGGGRRSGGGGRRSGGSRGGGRRSGGSRGGGRRR